MLFSESWWLKRAVKAWPVLNSGTFPACGNLIIRGGQDCMPRNSDKLVPPDTQCASSPGVFYPLDKINLVNFIRP